MKRLILLALFVSQSSFAVSLKPLNEMTEVSDATVLYIFQRCSAMYLTAESILMAGKQNDEAKKMHTKALELGTFALLFAKNKGMTNVTPESNKDAIQKVYDLYEEDILQSRAATGNMTDGVLKADKGECAYVYDNLKQQLNKN
ncbi:hypothetical protein OAH98_03315 [Methylophilaceae bacterium]|nr:hypothetical protein [Methylophilaceae bacterium]